MYKEVDVLIEKLKNPLIKCIYFESGNTNWFFNVFSNAESKFKETYRYLFFDGINGYSNKYNTIDDKKDRVVVDTISSFVDVIHNAYIRNKEKDGTDDKKTITIRWVLDDGMFKDMKENYGKLLYAMKTNTFSNTKVVFFGNDYSIIPDDLKQYTTLIKVPPPTLQEAEDIIETAIKHNNKDYIISKDNLKLLASSAIGLSYNEIRYTTNDSWIKHGDFLPEMYKTIRYDYIDKNPCLNVIKWEENYTDLVGLDKLKEFVVNMIKSGKGRGVLLVGIAGSGKSQFAKYLGHETNKLVVNFDLGKMKGKYVGETERMTRESIDTINAIGDCIVLVDEIEKGLSGVSGSGDSGASVNQGATFLKWLSDRKEGGAYVVATANNIEQLPSEYKRAERWDGIFFLDLPTEEIRDGILDYYIKYYELEDNKNEVLPLTDNWTGAEIKTMCRLSSALSKPCVEIAEEYITTIYSVDKDKIDKLRDWSVGRTISCEHKKDGLSYTKLIRNTSSIKKEECNYENI